MAIPPLKNHQLAVDQRTVFTDWNCTTESYQQNAKMKIYELLNETSYSKKWKTIGPMIVFPKVCK